MGKYLHAFDLAMGCTGVVIFDLDTLKPIHICSIETNDKHTHGKRLYHIAKEIHTLREKYPPSTIAIERGFGRFNTSTQVIYRVHGVLNYLYHDIDQIYYPPKTVKEAIRRGDASKKEIQEVISLKYPDVTFQNEDESDAFAVGITYLIKNKLLNWTLDDVKGQLVKSKKKSK